MLFYTSVIIIFLYSTIEIKAQTNWTQFLTVEHGQYGIKLNYVGLNTTDGLTKYFYIEILELTNNNLKFIGEIKFLIELRILDLSSNSIESVKELENLTKLTSLSLNSNQLHSVQGLYNLSDLTYLDLHSNQIQSVIELENLTQLTSLSLNSNTIQSVKGLENLTKLRNTLNLANNCIKEIYQFQFMQLSSLDNLYLENNRIKTIW